MTFLIQPKPGIMDIDIYQGGEARVSGIKNAVKLSSNENPFGPSRRVKSVYHKQVDFLTRYPNSKHAHLRAAIAQVHRIDANQIICGNGSDELIGFLTQAFAAPGDEVLYSAHGFLMYRLCTQAVGATPVVASEAARHTNVDALLAKCSDKTKLVFVANPNNPTSTMIDRDALARLADGLPPSALLVIDAAYAEYVPDYDGGAALVESRDNVVMLRTFSKIYGLAALRLGWAYAPAAIIDVLTRLRAPFNINSVALAVGIAAVQDTDYIACCREKNIQWRNWLTTELNAIGLVSDASFANFILIRFDSDDYANSADQYLKQNGLIVRRVASYNLPRCLRITVGTPIDCKRLVSVLHQFQKAKL